MDWMHESLFTLYGVTINAWKLIGYTGILMFSGRWVIQYFESRRAGRPMVTKGFWVMSLIGSTLSLLYFIFGKNDSVGVLANLFPAFVSAYNLMLQCRLDRQQAEKEARDSAAKLDTVRKLEETPAESKEVLTPSGPLESGMRTPEKDVEAADKEEAQSR